MNAMQSMMTYRTPDEVGRPLCEYDCKKTSKNEFRPKKHIKDTETMDGKDVFEIREKRES